MSDFLPPRLFSRLPRARIDPIDTQYRALAMIFEVMSPTPRPETIALTLDREHRGISVLVISETQDPDSILGIVDVLADRACSSTDAGAIILASVRPGGGPDYGDLGRWSEIDDMCADADLEFVEWFVLGRTITTPRELCSVDPRWSAA